MTLVTLSELRKSIYLRKCKIWVLSQVPPWQNVLHLDWGPPLPHCWCCSCAVLRMISTVDFNNGPGWSLLFANHCRGFYSESRRVSRCRSTGWAARLWYIFVSWQSCQALVSISHGFSHLNVGSGPSLFGISLLLCSVMTLVVDLLFLLTFRWDAATSPQVPFIALLSGDFRVADCSVNGQYRVAIGSGLKSRHIDRRAPHLCHAITYWNDRRTTQSKGPPPRLLWISIDIILVEGCRRVLEAHKPGRLIVYIKGFPLTIGWLPYLTIYGAAGTCDSGRSGVS